MPKIKIDHVVSFSSEDPVHIANNILSNDTAKKWKCKSPGEKSAVIVLQLEKASLISSIDIGNENSAYIEVFVTRSGTNDDFQVLLVMSSFMTPLEARQNTNVNKVRMFSYDQFSKPECDQKWDRVKIVCTQPFNRHVQYGLSFVTLHSREERTVASNVPATIGRFALRPDSPDNLSIGSLFERRKEFKEEQTLKGAAAIREASSSTSLSLYGSPACKPQLKGTNATPKNNNNISVDDKPLPRNRNELLYSKDEEEPNKKIDKLVENKATEVKEKQKKDEELLKEKKKKDEELIREKRKKKEKVETVTKKDDSIRKKQSPVKKDKNQLNNNNLFGESSKRKNSNNNENNNPNKKIKTVKNETTKKPFDQLLSGVIFVISGIQNPDRANLRTMGLSMGAKYSGDWKDNCSHLICAFQNTPKFNQVKGKGKIVTKKWIEDCYLQRKRLPWRRYALDKNDKSSNESEEEIWEKVADEDGSDTEIDENSNDTIEEDFEFVQTTTDNDTNQSLSNFPSYFENKRFFLDEHFDNDMTKLLNKYIIAYSGIIAKDLTDSNIDFVITENKSDFSNNSNVIYLRPDWIWECHNCQKFIPTDDYIL